MSDNSNTVLFISNDPLIDESGQRAPSPTSRRGKTAAGKRGVKAPEHEQPTSRAEHD